MDHRQEARLVQAKKFRSLYRGLGYTAATLAKFLHVSEASVYRWQRHGDVPTLVLRFLRLLSYHELPGRDWQGWHFSRGTLWSPEGHGFSGKDLAWLSLTLRRSQMFDVLYRERNELRAKLLQARQELAKAEEEGITAEGPAGGLAMDRRVLVAPGRRDQRLTASACMASGCRSCERYREA